jgi:hypothetical protein
MKNIYQKTLFYSILTISICLILATQAEPLSKFLNLENLKSTFDSIVFSEDITPEPIVPSNINKSSLTNDIRDISEDSFAGELNCECNFEIRLKGSGSNSSQREVTNCHPQNGKLTVEIFTCAGVKINSLTNYTFRWENNTTNTAVSSTNASISNQPPGTYTVFVTNNNCTNTLTETILLNVPTATAEVQAENISCENPNGSVRFDVGQAPDTGVGSVRPDYTLFIFQNTLGGTIVKQEPVRESTTYIYNDLPAGTYAYAISLLDNTKSDGTPCYTEPRYFTILDLRKYPVITFDTQPENTGCDPTTANASITATITNVSPGESVRLEWFLGDNTLTPFQSSTVTVGAGQNSLTSVLNQLSGGIYTLRATNLAVNCSRSRSDLISDNFTTPPNINFTINSGPTSCNSPNGSATISGGAANWTYEWYEGGPELIGTTPSLITTIATRNDLDAIQYTVVGKNELGCATNHVSFTIPENRVSPPVEITNLTPYTSCSTSLPNGGFTANVTGGNAGHTFQLYSGASATGTPIGTTNTYNNLNSGNYTFRVINTATGCSINVPIVINSGTPAYPEISLIGQVVQPTICNDATSDGSITVGVTGGNTGHTFEWYTGSTVNSANRISGQSSATLNNRPAGTYTVRAIRTSTMCPSNLITVTLNSPPDITGINISAIPDRSCVSNLTSGQASASVGASNVTTGYTFHWFFGSTTAGAIIHTGHTTPANLIGGQTYTVRVTNNATQCTGTRQILIPNDQPDVPVPVLTAVRDNSCVIDDGRVTAQIPGGNTGYSFRWYTGSVVNEANRISIGGVPVSGNEITDRPAGFYTVVAVDIATGCTSAAVNQQVLGPEPLPVITFSMDPDISCDPDLNVGLGRARITNQIYADNVTYSISWYRGTNANGTPIAFDNLTEIDNRNADNYFVVITHLGRQCTVTGLVNIPSVTETPAITTAVASHRTTCDPSDPDGSITVTMVGGNEGNYDFHWFRGAALNNPDPYHVSNDPIRLDEDSPVASQLIQGQYTVIAENRITKCKSAPITRTVNPAPPMPAMKVNIVDDITCSGTNLGSTTIVFDNGTPQGATIPALDYDFAWYNGIGTNGGIQATIDNRQNLAPGPYTVVVTNSTSGCQRTISVNVGQMQSNPVINATPVGITTCNGDNGIINVEFLGIYPFRDDPHNIILTNITDGTPSVTINNVLLPYSITDLSEAQYSVQVVNPVSGCSSNTIGNIFIDPAPAVDNFSVIVRDNTNCTGVTANGGARVSFIDGNGQEIVNFDYSRYIYIWEKYDAGTTTFSDVTVNDSEHFINEQSENVNAGDYYRVTLTNRDTDCEAVATFTIGATTVTPVYTAIATRNNICTPNVGDGSITLTASTLYVNSGDAHTFHWFTGSALNHPNPTDNSNNSIRINGVNGPILTGRKEGFYTAVAVNNVTGCVSPPVVTQILAPLPVPTVEVDFENASDCGPATPSGWASVRVPLSGNYTYTWSGNGITPQVGLTATALSAGTYKLTISNENDCFSEVNFSIGSETVTPVVQLVAERLTNCAPLIPDGSITSTLNYRFETDNHSYAWYYSPVNQTVFDASNPAIVLLNDNTPDLQNKPAGYYWLISTNDRTNCSSLPTKIRIQEANISFPAFSVEKKDSESCSPVDFPLGEARVALPGGAIPDANLYDFLWYEGSVIDDNAFLGNSVEIFNLRLGTHTLVYREKTSMCTGSISFNIGQRIVNPIFQLSATRLTICDPDRPDGTATATLNYEFEDDPHTFTWYRGQGTTGQIVTDGGGNNITSSILNNVPSGYYTAVALNDRTRCTSSPISIFIPEPIELTVDFEVTIQTSCREGQYNGAISAWFIDGGGFRVTSGYSFEWFRGTGTNPADALTAAYINPNDPSNAINLDKGGYTVRITNDLTGCAAILYPYVNEQKQDPVISASAIINNVTTCDNYDGSIQVTASNGSMPIPQGFSFDWYYGNLVDPDQLIAGENTSNLTGYPPGRYTVVVTNVYTGCDSEPRTFEIFDDSPQIQNSVEIVKNPNECDEADGELESRASAAGNTAGFRFDWYVGRQNADGSFLSNTPFLTENITTVTVDGTNPARNNKYISRPIELLSGYYSVVVTNLENQCQIVTERYLSYADAHEIEILTNPLPVTRCDQDNGSVELSVNIPAVLLAQGYTQASYEFTVYRGRNINPEEIERISIGQPLVTVIDGLAAGEYSIQAKDLITNCGSEPLLIIIEQHAYPPLVNEVRIEPHTWCVGNNGLIQIEINLDDRDQVNNSEGDGYTILWSSLNSFVESADQLTITQIEAGEYTVTITNNRTQCTTIRTFEVEREEEALVIDKIDETDSDDCNPLNGSLNIVRVVRNGVLIADSELNDANLFSFEWFDNLELTGDPLVGRMIDGIEEGTYYARITDLISGCTFVKSARVDKISLPPVVQVLQAQADISCNTTGTGTLSASVLLNGTFTTDPALYSFRWFRIENDDRVGGSFHNGPIATGLSAGEYEVEVEDLTSPNRGCITLNRYTLESIPPVISLNASNFTVTDVTNCTPQDGAITINSVFYDGELQPFGNYDFRWVLPDLGYSYIEGGNTFTVDANGVVLLNGVVYTGNILRGLSTYNVEVEAIHRILSCTSNPFNVFVDDITVEPLLSINIEQQDISCDDDPANATGRIVAEVVGANQAEYSFVWVNVNTNQVVSNDRVAANLPPGSYQVIVTDNTIPDNGCSTTSLIYNIQRVPSIVEFADAEIEIIDNDNCNPFNGSITINNLMLNGSLASHTEFDFEWVDENDASLPNGNGNTATLLGPGIYKVRVTHRDLNCESIFKEIIIENDYVAPQVVIVQTAFDTNCGGALTGTGRLEAYVLEPGNPNPVTANYEFVWYDVTNNQLLQLPQGEVDPNNEFVIINVMAGQYRVEARKINSSPGLGCPAVSSQPFDLNRREDRLDLIDNGITIINTNNCAAGVQNGEIIVNNILLNGLNIAIADYPNRFEFTFSQGGNELQKGFANSISDLAPGTYSIQLLDIYTNCPSGDPLIKDVIIRERTVDPIVQVLQDRFDESCVGGNPTGILRALVLNDDPQNPGDYTYIWSEDLDEDGIFIEFKNGIENFAEGLIAGAYKVRVIKTNEPNQACDIEETYYLNRREPIITVLDSSIRIKSQEDCNPADGEIEVLEVLNNGTPITDFSEYEFIWKDTDGNEIDATNRTSLFAGIATGDYLLQVHNTVSNCFSEDIELFVPYEIHQPNFVLVQTAFDEYCDENQGGTGALRVDLYDINGNQVVDFSNYTISWFKVDENDNNVDLTTAVPGAILNASNSEATNLVSGFYRITVLNTGSFPGIGCDNTITFELTNDPPVFDISSAEADLDVVFATDCEENGSIEILAVFEEGVRYQNDAPEFNNYSFTWSTSDDITDTGAHLPETGSRIEDKAPGIYYVWVTNDISGCTSAEPKQIILESYPPFVVIDVESFDESCEGPGSGILSAVVLINRILDNGSFIGGVPNTDRFDFRWFEGMDNQGTEILANLSGENNSIISGLSTGFYTVEATSRSNGACLGTATFQLEFRKPEYLIVDADFAVTPMTDCIPNGTAIINSVMKNGVVVADFDQDPEYTFLWMDANGNELLDQDGNSLPPNTRAIAGLPSGTYLVKIINKGCESPLKQFVIEDQTNPVIAGIDLDSPDYSCSSDPSVGTGQLSAYVIENNIKITAGYTFSWYLDNRSSGTPFRTGPIAEDLPAGTYTVRVTKDDSPDAGCFSLVTYRLEKRDNFFFVPDLQDLITHQTDCQPNGAILITELAEFGIIRPVTDFILTWFDADRQQISDFDNNPNPIGFSAGIYYLMATSLISECDSELIPFEILDNTIPMVTVFEIANNTNCSGTPSGRVTVTVTTPGDEPALGYSYSWVLSTNPSEILSTTNVLNQQAEGLYILTVRNNSTLCEITREVFIGTDQSSPLITSIQPGFITVCNGTAEISILEVQERNSVRPLSNYRFHWYNGSYSSGATADAILDTPTYENLIPGTYFVIAENITTGCRSLPHQVEVELFEPQYRVAFNIDPVIFQEMCQGPPNGGLEILSIERWVFNSTTREYQFDGNPYSPSDYEYVWYSGSQVSSSMRIEGFETERLSEQAAGLYTVSFTDGLTGCTETATYIIEERRSVGPIEIEDVPNTSCIELNGSISAFVVVNGVRTTDGFTFRWFDVNNNFLYEGPVLREIEAGYYFVDVTEISRGCTSREEMEFYDGREEVPSPDVEKLSDHDNCANPNGAARASVDGQTDGYTFIWRTTIDNEEVELIGIEFNDLVAATYRVYTRDNVSFCESEPTEVTIIDKRIYPEFTIFTKNAECGRNNGYAKVEIDSKKYDISKIEWITPEGVREGLEFDQAPEGEYEVRVTLSNGCFITKTFEIGKDIFVYNGISANEDGDNDFMTIECIHLFPQNNVKIYNRIGTLVFEMDGYDNDRFIFNGISNKGLSAGPRILPSGTYFYVVDKRDGSKPKSGFVELVR